MKRMLRLSVCFLLAFLFTPAPVAFAKGAPDKVTITGPGLAAPIEISDPGILDQFNPWDGQFLDKDRTAVTDTPQGTAPYEVLFYFKDAGGELRLFYAFQYLPEPSGMRGRIYLPQENEKYYDMNNFTIARRSGWLYANPQWDSFVKPLLVDQRNSAPTFWPSVTGDLITPIVGALVVIFGSVMLWFLRRKRGMST